MSARQIQDLIDATEVVVRNCNLTEALEGSAERLSARERLRAARDSSRLTRIQAEAMGPPSPNWALYSPENVALRRSHAHGLTAAGVPPPHAQRRSRALQSSPAMPDLFVDYANGSDANNGTLNAPFKTLAAAWVFSTSRPYPSFQTIWMRGGMHYMGASQSPCVGEDGNNYTPAVCPGPDDSNLAIMAFPGETPVLSGGMPMSVTWKRSPTPGVWMCENFVWTPGQGAPIPALSIGGHRATLARFPNADPERCFSQDGQCYGLPSYENTWVPADANSSWLPFNTNSSTPGNSTYTVSFGPGVVDPNRGIYINFTMGYSGNADRYQLPTDGQAMGGQSLWASADFRPTIRWQGMHLRSPRGLNYSNPDGTSMLPHAPYASLAQGVVHAWRQGGWFSWQFAGLETGGGQHQLLSFGKGGFQGGEGADRSDNWYIEGMLEELDAPNEFFHDVANSILYLFPNATDVDPVTGAPPSELVIPAASLFFYLYGAQEFSTDNVTLEGLTLTHMRPTFMDPHGVPSGGDWALERQAAVMMEGTVDSAVIDCNFTRLDGNAILIQNYNRYTKILGNEFSWLGGSAVASWGFAQNEDGTGNPSGRGGHCRNNTVSGNIMRELGLLQKQSSGYTQFLTGLSNVSHNVMYNMPRAAINFNDGFGGGNIMSNNVLFNTCRESGDHGAFNSWDRLPYVTTIRDGHTRTTLQAFNNMHHNVIVSNYNADAGCFDTDDGSSFYKFWNNVCYGGGHKSNFDGHAKESVNNLHIFPGVYGYRCAGWFENNFTNLQGAPEKYVNNTCIQSSVPAEGAGYEVLWVKSTGFGCPNSSAPGFPGAQNFTEMVVLANNTFFSPGGWKNLTLACEDQSFRYELFGWDNSSTALAEVPDAWTILGMARALLQSPRPDNV